MSMSVIFLLCLVLTVVASLANDMENALRSDDQCFDAGDGYCVLHALQVRGLKSREANFAATAEEARMNLDDEVDDHFQAGMDGGLLHEGGEMLDDAEDVSLVWLKDISVKRKNLLKRHLQPLQKVIVAVYNELLVLDKFANYTMAKVANATGEKVTWNAKSKFLSLLQADDVEQEEQEDEQDEEEQEEEEEEEEKEEEKEEEEEEEADEVSRYGRRRRSSRSLPPRARYINKLLIYLDKEMHAVWRLHTMVDRKRWGIGNTITSHPYGPHGEHPKDWKPNGSFPIPLVTPPLSAPHGTKAILAKAKAHSHKFKNKYAIQLQQDTETLVSNIKDAHAKANDLRKSLKKMDGHAEEFIASESGVFSRTTIE